MTIRPLGIDVANNTSQLYGTISVGKEALRKRLRPPGSDEEGDTEYNKAKVALANKNALNLPVPSGAIRSKRAPQPKNSRRSARARRRR